MKWSSCPWSWCVGFLAVAMTCWFVTPLLAQAAGDAAPRTTPATQETVRPLAPGVMQAVEPRTEVDESYSRHDIVQLLAVDPNLDFVKNVPFRRDIWYLEFRFKPVRMLWIDVPQPSGQMRRQLIWYMVYSVTNPGKALHPTEEADGTYKIVTVDKPIRFIPEFLLDSPEVGKAYPDRVIPVAMGPIRRREEKRRDFQLHNSVEMTREIQVGETAWGVATWENVDPTIDRFSIYVGGLTNAYRWQDDPGAYKPGDDVLTGRHLVRKTLKLNFWRPGDEYYQNEKEIRFGAPGEVDYEWVYR